MNDHGKIITSVIAAAGAVSLERVATVFSIAAALVAILAGLPVVIDRWGPYVRRFLGWFSK